MLAMDQHHQEESCVPPGFRFHPTEEELVGYYLARKVAAQKIDLDIIQEVDLYRIEPWDLQERCGRGGGGGGEDDLSSSSERYFFSFKDRKYPSGTRTNRATAAGFWKATGRDKPVLSSRSSRSVIGMRKTLVFYKGRAPNGRKTDWIIHEYRLQTNEHAPTQEEGWVVCRAFQKPVPNQRNFVFPAYAAAPGSYYEDARLHLHGHGHGRDLHYLHPAASGAGGFAFPGHDQFSEDFESKKNLFSNIPQLVESPPATTAVVEQQQQQGQGASANAIDWNFLDSLLSTSLLHDSYSAASATAASHLHLEQ
uniref:Uncharacterized protein n=2 Tax=Avena sativa TaxID=4498 RepID=A0ACD5TQJ2_AVESA